ncbi:MAG: hypothetical protein AAGE43_09060 [Pseudomonadota bacterium]
MIRSLLGFIAAVLVTYVIGAALATQHVLGALTVMGMNIDFGVWAQATLHDLRGMFMAYASLIAVAFLVATPVVLLVCRGRPGWRRFGYTVGFFAAIMVMHTLMPMVLNVSPVASTRFFGGLLQQGLAGAVGGYVFFLVGRSASLVRAAEGDAGTPAAGTA